MASSLFCEPYRQLHVPWSVWPAPGTLACKASCTFCGPYGGPQVLLPVKPSPRPVALSTSTSHGPVGQLHILWPVLPAPRIAARVASTTTRALYDQPHMPWFTRPSPSPVVRMASSMFGGCMASFPSRSLYVQHHLPWPATLAPFPRTARPPPEFAPPHNPDCNRSGHPSRGQSEGHILGSHRRLWLTHGHRKITLPNAPPHDRIPAALMRLHHRPTMGAALLSIELSAPMGVCDLRGRPPRLPPTPLAPAPQPRPPLPGAPHTPPALPTLRPAPCCQRQRRRRTCWRRCGWRPPRSQPRARAVDCTQFTYGMGGCGFLGPVT